MSRSETRKDAMLDKLADFVLEYGLEQASLRPMARSAGTSDRMLIYHFKDKEGLIAATLERIAGRLTAHLAQQCSPNLVSAEALRGPLLDMALDDEIWPYLRLWLQVAARAAQGDAFFTRVGGQIGQGFLDWIAVQLDDPDAVVRQQSAAKLLVEIEGLVLVKSVGLGTLCRAALEI